MLTKRERGMNDDGTRSDSSEGCPWDSWADYVEPDKESFTFEVFRHYWRRVLDHVDIGGEQ